MTDETNDLYWFDTERLLAQDEDGAERDALIEQLRNAELGLKREIDAGVPPSEFDKLERMRSGVVAADEVLRQIWAGYHPGR